MNFSTYICLQSEVCDGVIVFIDKAHWTYRYILTGYTVTHIEGNTIERVHESFVKPSSYVTSRSTMSFIIIMTFGYLRI